MKAIITVGVSGSGKTTWARKTGFATISRDDIRADIYEQENDDRFSWKKWSWKKEDDVTRIQNIMIDRAAKNGFDLVIADTNLNKCRAFGLKKKLEDLGYDVEFKFFHGRQADPSVDIETCIKRDAERELSVGALVINKQWKQMIDSWGDEIISKYKIPENADWCVIFDIDGTLADHEGLRSPFDWKQVGNDRVRHHVRELLDLYTLSGYKIILLSGRDAVCRDETIEWLGVNGIHYDHLFMREENDSRSDSIVKLELFDAHIRDKFFVRVVVDDRKRVLQVWHDLGLNVINVGHINEYF